MVSWPHVPTRANLRSRDTLPARGAVPFRNARIRPAVAEPGKEPREVISPPLRCGYGTDRPVRLAATAADHEVHHVRPTAPEKMPRAMRSEPREYRGCRPRPRQGNRLLPLLRTCRWTGRA